MCANSERTELTTRLQAVEPETMNPDRGDLVVVRDRNGRAKAYRRIGRRQGKLPAGESTSPNTQWPPRAPTPPVPPGTHWHPLDAKHCTKADCTMMSGALRKSDTTSGPRTYFVEERSPRINFGTSSASFTDSLDPKLVRTKSVRIKTPSEFMDETPKISAPPTARSRRVKSEHQRHDSAMSFSLNDEPLAGPSQQRPSRPAPQNNQYTYDEDLEHRDLAILRDRLNSNEAARLQADKIEQARLASIEMSRLADRVARRQADTDAERKRLSAQAAQDSADRVQREVQAEQIRQKRYRNEARDRQRESFQYTTEITQPQRAPSRGNSMAPMDLREDFVLFPDDCERPSTRLRNPSAALVAPDRPAESASPVSPRRRNARSSNIVIHDERDRTTLSRQLDPRNTLLSSEDIIERERRRMDEEDMNNLRSPHNDPFDEDAFSGSRRRGTREWSLSQSDERRARMRKYREDREERYK